MGLGLGRPGQLGDGGLIDRSTPVQVAGVSNAVAVSAGSDFALALKSDGTVWGWGYNVDGELGRAPLAAGGTQSTTYTMCCRGKSSA